MAGKRGKVSRILPAATVVLLVAAGCGGAARPQTSTLHGVPSALAQNWARQASAIAAAAAARNDCRARVLAVSLRRQVRQKERSLPLRLRSPLVTGLDSLVERTTCTRTVTPKTTTPPSPPPKPHGPKPPHKQHDHPGHGHHGHGGDQGGDQGGDG